MRENVSLPDDLDTLDIFVNEDLKKPENRVNVALFFSMQQNWFREWFLHKLDLDPNAIVYPPKNTEKRTRPDLVVVKCGKRLAWVEVELSKNSGQLREYEKQYNEPIKAVWGESGDLSLVEIACYLEGKLEGKSQEPLPLQATLSVMVLVKLIWEGIEGHVGNSSRGRISEEMCRHPLVKGLKEWLKDNLRCDSGPLADGELRADTVGKGGFSLRVWSAKASKGTVSILNISGSTGDDIVRFSTKKHLEKYLPRSRDEINNYVAFLHDIDSDINPESSEGDIRIRMDKVLKNLDKLVCCLQDLARKPRA